MIDQLISKYKKACKNNDESFVLMGNEVLTQFAKYQLEYLASINKGNKALVERINEALSCEN